MKRKGIWLYLSLNSLYSLSLTFAQQRPESSLETKTVPRLVRFSGAVKDAGGNPQNGVMGITFSLYKQEHSGEPLWHEIQNVQLDANGYYSVLLGASLSEGLPAEMFTTNEARWLGVEPVGQAEQPRVLLLSVPYALKAADAETLGGIPASAFLTATPPGEASNAA